MEKAIENYLKKPDKLDCSNILIQAFFELFSEEDFSREDADLILDTFFEILDVEIEKYPEIIIYLDHYLAKLTYCEVQETNQGVHELSKGIKEISLTVQEIHKVVNGSRADKSRKELEADFNESIKKYLNRIIEEEGRTGINEVYTELSAKEILPVTLKFRDEENNKMQEFEVLELVEKEEKLIISGESGSGKTTTLRWLNYTLAKSFLEGKNEKIPLYIELNSYISEERFIKKPFDAYVAMKAEGKSISEDTFKTILKGKAVILLDGFDLLSPTDEFQPYDKISNFITDYNNCRFVISSRPGFFESIKSSFKVSELEKLTDKKIEIFINRYVSNEELANTLKDKILYNQRLKSILSNPMMLYIAVKVAMRRKDKSDDLLPSDRSELYEAFISTLFSHQEEKGKHLHADRIQIENALTDLCFKLQCKNEVSCKYSEALKFVKEIAEDSTFRKFSPQAILEDCFKLGILNKKDYRVSYEIHQSFQEYFAAIKIKELIESGFDVSEAFCHPKWEEVIIFTSEMLECVDKFIDSMISKGELFLASKCISKAGEKTKEKLCALLADKMDSKHEMEKINSIESLGRIGNVGISIIIEALKDEDEYVRWKAVEALGNIKSDISVQPLIDALKDEDEDVRFSLEEALGEIGSEKAVQLLINALEDEDSNVRESAAYALGNIGSEEAVQPLINALKDEDSDVRESAVEALKDIKSEAAVQPLINALKDENKDVRESAAYLLGYIGSEETVQPLINSLNDEDSNVRESVVGALEDIKSEAIKSEKAVQLLIYTLKNENKDVRESAAYVLGYIRSEKAIQPLIDALKDADSNVRKSVIETLGYIGSEKAIQPLIDALKDADSNVRKSVIETLGYIRSEKAMQPLIDALKDEDSNARKSVVEALGDIGSGKAVQPLINVLKDEDSNVRKSAVKALKDIKSEAAVKPLIDVLKDEDPNVRKSAVEALKDIKSEAAVKPLIDVLKDEDPNVRRSAVETLEDIKSEATVKPLIDALKDEDSNVRESAAYALGNIGSEEAVQPLIDALKDEDSNVRKSVAEALKDIKSEAAVQPLINALKDENKDVRESAIGALEDIKLEATVKPLINVLKDENEDVRWCATKALGNIKSDTALELLINALRDEDPKVRKSVAHALGDLKSEKAVQPLINALKDADSGVRQSVVYALRNIKSEKVVQPLIDTLKDEDSNVRQSVAYALGYIGSEKAVQPLIDALKDEDSNVQWSAADSLSKTCTVRNKKQLKDLLKSDYELSVNTAFEILTEIEKEERSKLILFEKIHQYRMKETDGHGHCSGIEHVRPAEEGLIDAYFGLFVDKFKSVKEPITIVDYGCGEGKLLCAMITLPENALKNISYIGVDLLTRCRYMAGLAAKKHGLTDKLCNEPEFIKPATFFQKGILADYILFMHVLHEIELVYLPDLIHSFSTKLKIGGKILILDQKELVEKERSFVLWDEKEDFEMLFKGSGFESHVRYFETGSGKKLSSIEIEKIQDKSFRIEDAGRNCLAVYKSKQAKLLKKRKIGGFNDAEYDEISVQYTNVSEQIAEYERTIDS